MTSRRQSLQCVLTDRNRREADGPAAGGYYLFRTEGDARRFEAQTRASLAEIEHAVDPRTRLFVVREDVSAVTGALGAC